MAAKATKGTEQAATTVTEPETTTTEQVAKNPPVYVIKVNNNPNFCGIGAGGVQFANGTATTTSERMAAWFKEHPGYTVTKE